MSSADTTIYNGHTNAGRHTSHRYGCAQRRLIFALYVIGPALATSVAIT